jgi:hypothetical protein
VQPVTAFGLGDVPEGAYTSGGSGNVAGDLSGLAPSATAFIGSSAFGFLLLVVIFLYIHRRIL